MALVVMVVTAVLVVTAAAAAAAALCGSLLMEDVRLRARVFATRTLWGDKCDARPPPIPNDPAPPTPTLDHHTAPLAPSPFPKPTLFPTRSASLSPTF